MFSTNLTFESARKKYRKLLKEKEGNDLAINAIEGEFTMYATRKADDGDEKAQKWLVDNNRLRHDYNNEEVEWDGFTFEREGTQDDEAVSSPMEHFIERDPMTLAEIDDLLQPLNQQIGLKSVKEEIRNMAMFAQVQRRRRQQNIEKVAAPALHMVFSGRPGTGKTTVARLLVPILREMGVIHNDTFVEVERTDLVGEYIGQSAVKTQEVLERATGGVLFIDEAYTLSMYKNAYANTNDFGEEVIATLLKFMEDNRHNTVVIAAGYKDHMASFLRSNPGLKSRFPIHIEFPDYTVDELLDIFYLHCDQNGLSLSEETSEAARLCLKTYAREAGDDHANGRAVRTLLEEALRRQAVRIMEEDIHDAGALMALEPEDIRPEGHQTEGNISYLKPRAKPKKD